MEKIIEDLRLAMREGCNCKACEEENANIGEGCVIRKALHTAQEQITKHVTRFEVVDHRTSFENGGGRVFTAHDVRVGLSLQDNNRTLKVFISAKTTTP